MLHACLALWNWLFFFIEGVYCARHVYYFAHLYHYCIALDLYNTFWKSKDLQDHLEVICR